MSDEAEDLSEQSGASSEPSGHDGAATGWTNKRALDARSLGGDGDDVVVASPAKRQRYDNTWFVNTEPVFLFD